jgi:hypothetical protein
MFRRLTALVFIILANMILLAHAVVPHSHIDGVVHFFHHHSHSNGESHHHGIPESDQSDNSHNNTDFCLLNQSVQVTRNQVIIIPKVDEIPSVNHMIILPVTHINTPHFFNVSPPFFEIRYSLASALICCGTGFRAPPVV